MDELWINFWVDVLKSAILLVGSTGVVLLTWYLSKKEINEYQKKKDDNLMKIEILKLFNPIVPQLHRLISSHDKGEFDRNKTEISRVIEGYMNLVPMINLHYTTDIGNKIGNSMAKITTKISNIASMFASDPNKKDELYAKIGEIGEFLDEIYSIVIHTPFNK